MSILRYVPHFLIEKDSAGKKAGGAKATAVFLDISGFTVLTRTLMEHGTEGAEVLSSIINDIYTPLIETVYRYGGFISGFAGDAFTAIFPGKETGTLCIKDAVDCGWSLRRQVVERDQVETRFGVFPIGVKIGISYGNFSWQLLDADIRTGYFSGKAIERAAKMESLAQRGQIIADKAVKKIIKSQKGRAAFTSQKDGYLLAEWEPSEAGELPVVDFTPEIIRTYLPAELHDRIPRGEFRVVTSVFVRFDDYINVNEQNLFLTDMINRLKTYGGYLSGIDFADKGNHFLALFGVPVSHEDDFQRAVVFTLELVKEHPGFHAGISRGRVYSGDVGSDLRAGFTVLGESVNLAARLMAEAGVGEILVTEEEAKKHKEISFEEKGEKFLKGIGEVSLYRLKDVQNLQGSSFAENILFSGREKELSQLEKVFQSLGSERVAFLLQVHGRAGVGKTRLLEEAVRKAAGVRFIHLRADSVLKKSLNPFISFFRSQLFENDKVTDVKSFEERLRGHLEKNNLPLKLMERSSYLAAVLGIFQEGSPYSHADPQARMENTLLFFEEYFLSFSTLQPLILILDDAYAIDIDARMLLRRLIESAGGLKIGFVFLVRESFREELFPGLETKLQRLEIRLRELVAEESFTLLSSLLNGEPSTDLHTRLQAKTNGNPFFLLQLTEYLRESGKLVREEKGWDYTGEFGELPENVMSFLSSRLDQLTVDLREAVFTHCVYGQEFEYALWKFRQGEKDNEKILDEGERERMFHRDAEKIYFTSDLIRQSACDMQLKSNLREKHLQAAESIQAVYSEDRTRYADIAYHYDRGEDFPNARKFYILAAEFARDNYKNDKALEFFQRARVLSDGSHGQVIMDLEIIEILDLTGHWDELLSTIDEDLYLCEKERFNEEFLRFILKQAEIFQKKGDYFQAHTALNRTGEAEGELAVKRELLRSRVYWSEGKYDDAIVASGKVFEYKPELREQALALYYKGVALRDKGELKEAESQYRESETIFTLINDDRYVTYPQYDMAVIYQYRGETEKSREYFTRVLEKYKEIGYRSGESAALLNLGILFSREGKWDDALKLVTESLSVAEKIHEKMAIAYTLYVLGWFALETRDYKRSYRELKHSLQLMVEIGSKGYYGYPLGMLARLYLETSRFDAAEKTILRHLKILQDLKSDPDHGLVLLNAAQLNFALKGKISDQLKNELKHAYNDLNPDTGSEIMFSRAVEIAEKADYEKTFLPAMRQYAAFLSSSGKRESAGEVLQRGLEISRSRQNLEEEKKIRQLADVL